MTKVVYASLKSEQTGPSGAVTKKRVMMADGSSVMVHTVDAESPSFPEDLSYVFRKNVERARRAQKKAGLDSRGPSGT